MAFVEASRGRETAGLRWGVEPICRVLQVAPSTYYATERRPPCRRKVEDAALKEPIRTVYQGQFEVYGAEKLWRQLHREGLAVGRDRVARLLGELGIAGATRAKTARTTVRAKPEQPLPADLVHRNFTATAPNELWVNDLTYVPLRSGFASTAFVIDAYSRRIVGWQVATSLRAELALDALELAIWARRAERLDGLVHHADRGQPVPGPPLHGPAGGGRDRPLGRLQGRLLRHSVHDGGGPGGGGGLTRPTTGPVPWR